MESNESQNHFSILNYAVFAMTLVLSALIGVYFGFISKKKQNTTVEYLLGGKQMSYFPIAASLVASHVSGATFIAVPSEVYAFGSEYMISGISAAIQGLALIYIYLPVFYDLQLTSSFFYLEQRFDRKIRLMSSLLYILCAILFIPLVIYVPALAFAQVSGINLYIVACLTSIVCIFYTTVGGLKAVVWTDTLQFILMVGGIIAVTILGLMATGGFWNVWETADAGGRLIFFNMNPSPFVRISFWTYTIGMSTTWIAKHGISQDCIQRFMAVKDIKVAKRALMSMVVGIIFIKCISAFGGLIIYTKYQTCDPLKAGKIEKLDQILPYFIMQVTERVPGLPGLFIAGIFSAALSSMSTTLNTVSGTIFEDFIRPNYPKMSEAKASRLMKIFVVILGMTMLSMVFVVDKMGQVFRLNFAIAGLFTGTLLGLFTIGMFSRTANTKGVFCGTIGSLTLMSILIIGAQSLPKHPPLPFRTDGCDPPINETIASSRNYDDYSSSLDKVPLIFQLSFMYYTLIGALILFTIALPVSWFTGGCAPFDERLLTPMMRSKHWKQKTEEDQNEMKVEKVFYATVNREEEEKS